MARGRDARGRPVTGWQLRTAAALVLALAPALTLVAGWTAHGECANLAAVAAFLVVLAPGPDAYGAAHPSRAHLRWALLWLRLGVGTALIVLAFSENLTNPAMAIDTLERYPALLVYGSSKETFRSVRWLPGRTPRRVAAPVPVA